MIKFKLFIKKILFPGIDVAIRKRMKFAKYFKSGDILTLDAGCGNGAFSFEAVEKGNQVIGIDFDSEKLKRCEEFRDYLKIDSQRCQFKIYNLYELESFNEKFDQIICLETLEHIKDDQKIINNFSLIIKPGGILHLCAPYADRKPYYGEIISSEENGGHIRLGYTFEQFEKMLKKENFKIIRRDSAVGFFSQKIISLFNWISSNFLSNKSDAVGDIVRTLTFMVLYPITFLDIIIPGKQLIIYVKAEKTV